MSEFFLANDGRMIQKLQCSGCGCGYVVGLDPDSQRYAQDVKRAGHGLKMVPTPAHNCGCHSGEGIKPPIRAWYAPGDE